MNQKLQILIQQCEALDHRHSNGVVHRDVKPENISLTRELTVKVVDFGLSIEADLPGTKGVVGTIPYLASEQLREAKSVLK